MHKRMELLQVQDKIAALVAPPVQALQNLQREVKLRKNYRQEQQFMAAKLFLKVTAPTIILPAVL